MWFGKVINGDKDRPQEWKLCSELGLFPCALFLTTLQKITFQFRWNQIIADMIVFWDTNILRKMETKTQQDMHVGNRETHMKYETRSKELQTILRKSCVCTKWEWPLFYRQYGVDRSLHSYTWCKPWGAPLLDPTHITLLLALLIDNSEFIN